MRPANSVDEYFRCPENIIQLELVGPLSADSGYFLFGPEAICYGTSSSGFRSRQVTGPLHDVLADGSADPIWAPPEGTRPGQAPGTGPG